MSGLQEARSIPEIFSYVNSITGGLFVGGGVLIFFFVMTIALVYRTSLQRALMVSSTFSLIITLMFSAAGMMNAWYSLVFAAVLAFSGLWEYMNRE